jgi:hypothetical protein
MLLDSPFATVTISDVRKLTGAECQVAVREDALGVDSSLNSLDADFGEAPSLDNIGSKKAARAVPADYKTWTAEVFIPWLTLGVTGVGENRVDFGIHNASKNPGKVDKTTYWSNTATEFLDDTALASLINPAAWGRFAQAQKGGL